MYCIVSLTELVYKDKSHGDAQDGVKIWRRAPEGDGGRDGTV